jgi:hypothetical protein
MIRVQIDSFDSGTIAALSPNLWMVVDSGFRHPRPAKNTGHICERCGRPVQTFGFLHGLGEPERAERVLRWDCLTIIYRFPITEGDITKNWTAFRQLKSKIATQLVALDQPERN